MKNFYYIVHLLFVSVILFLVISCQNDRSDSYNELLEKEIAGAKISEVKELYFVGSYKGKASIYKFSIEANRNKLFWNDEDERVIDLLISEDRLSAYFLTRRKQRLKSSQPAIETGKLYRIDFELQKVEMVSRLEEGIQIIPYWIDNDRFTLVINSIDKTIASYINKNIQIYNRFGKLLSDNNEIFDLTKDGYPITKLPGLEFESPNKLFKVLQNNDSIQVLQTNNKTLLSTGLTKKSIREIGWAENNKQLVLLLSNQDSSKSKLTDNLNTDLIVFDLQLKRIVKTFSDKGFQRFVLIGDLLIFDSGLDKDSFIRIIKLSSLEDYRTIKISGGCSLRNISTK